MKFLKHLKSSKLLINISSVCLIALAGIITSTASFALMGEVSLPDSLREK